MTPTTILEFPVPRARGDILPLNRWTVKLDASQRVVVSESGVTHVDFGGESNAYLVAGGTVGDFKVLGLNSGVERPSNSDLLVSSDVETKNITSVQLAALEFDENRRRCGQVWFEPNCTARLNIAAETKYVLFVIRVAAVKGSRFSMHSVTAETVKRNNEIGFERVQYLESNDFNVGSLPEEFRNKLNRATALLDGLNSNLQRLEIVSSTENMTRHKPKSDVSHSLASQKEKFVLLRSKIFDKTFYSANVGLVFESQDEAMQHYLTWGMPNLFSCHPLIDCSVLEPDAKTLLKNGNLNGFLNYLSKPHKQVKALSEFFYPRYLELEGNDISNHPGGCVGWFIEHANDSTFLPTTTRGIRWSQFRNAVHRASLDRIDDLRSEQRNYASSVPGMEISHDLPAKEHAIAGQGEELVHPLVTVVALADGQLANIERSLTSILTQSYTNFELIVVSNTVNPSFREKIDRLVSGDSRASVIYEVSTNRGRLWNRGIDCAKGDYIALIRSGYEWDVDHLAKLTPHVQSEGADYAFSQVKIFDGELQTAWGAPLDSVEIIKRNSMDFSAIIFSRYVGESREVRFDSARKGSWEHSLAIRMAEELNGVVVESPSVSFIEKTTVAEFEKMNRDPLGLWTLLGEKWLDWESASRKETVTGRTSIVMPVYGQRDLTVTAVESVLNTSIGWDLEIVLVDNGSSFEDYWRLAAAYSGEQRIRIVHLPFNFNFALGSNIGAIESTGEYVFFLNNDTEVQPGWLQPLIDQIRGQGVLGVQPLLLYPDDSIQSAGTAFVLKDELPVPFLVHQPKEAAEPVGDTRFDVITAAAMLVRRNDFIRVKGFDPIFINGMEDVDLCLRMCEEGGHFRVESKSLVYHHESKTPGRGTYITQNRHEFLKRWRKTMPTPDLKMWQKCGLKIANIGTDGNEIPSPKVTLMSSEDKPNRQWGLKFAAPGGSKGDTWGDTYFVESLRDALIRQNVVARTYRHGPNTNYVHSHDQVNLVIRGLDRVAPVPGKVNVIWLISHPEAVTPHELAGFDIVYVASEIWAEEIERKYGISARVLHQATDTSRFNTEVDPDMKRRHAVFVGSVHTGRRRSIVEDAVAARVPFSVIGKGWKGQLPDSILEGEHIPNEKLASVYRSADVVLAEHWPLMGQLGFVQNRLFDAVASGCRVVSDPVPGVEELFGGAVQTYRTVDELRFLLSDEGRSCFPDAASLQRIAERVQRKHSFDARASRMIRDIDAFVAG
ncbi:glycosyltransferase [Corynebacterium casei]|uniref:glycosyltransferase n=1 Tax=Corynebacterium casei TaxID=160386 RepID=UPI003FD055E4